jgi:hypothetical protein
MASLVFYRMQMMLNAKDIELAYLGYAISPRFSTSEKIAHIVTIISTEYFCSATKRTIQYIMDKPNQDIFDVEKLPANKNTLFIHFLGMLSKCFKK